MRFSWGHDWWSQSDTPPPRIPQGCFCCSTLRSCSINFHGFWSLRRVFHRLPVHQWFELHNMRLPYAWCAVMACSSCCCVFEHVAHSTVFWICCHRTWIDSCHFCRGEVYYSSSEISRLHTVSDLQPCSCFIWRRNEGTLMLLELGSSWVCDLCLSNWPSCLLCRRLHVSSGNVFWFNSRILLEKNVRPTNSLNTLISFVWHLAQVLQQLPDVLFCCSSGFYCRRRSWRYRERNFHNCGHIWGHIWDICRVSWQCLLRIDHLCRTRV